jgi:hypothetical protein
LLKIGTGLAALLLLVSCSSGDETSSPTTERSTTTTTGPAPVQDVMELSNFSRLEPGPYVIDPDGDDTTPLRVTYQVASDGWEQWFGAVKSFTGGDYGGFTGLSIITVSNLVIDGCRNHKPLEPPVGATVDDLANALTKLAPFELTAPPSDVTLRGYKGKHVKLTVPKLKISGTAHDPSFADCRDGEVHSWIAPINGGSFYGFDGPGQSEEYWILDVDGTRLVLVKFDTPQAPASDRAERDAIFDSIRIKP